MLARHDLPFFPEQAHLSHRRGRLMRFSRSLPTADSQRGWTLMEAMVALAIVLLLAACLVPALGSLVQRHRLIAVAHSFRSDVQKARALAVQYQAPVHLALSSQTGSAATGSGYLMHLGQAGDCRFSASGQARCVADEQLLRQVWWSAAQAVQLRGNVERVSFNPRQGAVTPTGSVDLWSRDGQILRQVIGISGRVRSCSPDGRLPAYPQC